jgi:hypothetical protein
MAIGYSLLAIRYWLLAIGYWLWAIGQSQEAEVVTEQPIANSE